MRPQESSFDTQSTQDVFAFGVDLFHAGYFWEAHEAWEYVWHQADAGSSFEGVVRASIRTTAAHVKRRQDNERGVISHRRGARGHLETLPAFLDFVDLRIDVALFRERLDGNGLPSTLPVERRVETLASETTTGPIARKQPDS